MSLAPWARVLSEHRTKPKVPGSGAPAPSQDLPRAPDPSAAAPQAVAAGAGGGAGAAEGTEGDRFALKALTLGTAAVLAVNVVPYIGEPLIVNTMSLARAKGDFFQRSGVWRLEFLARYTPEKMVELGVVDVLAEVAGGTRDTETQRLCLKALERLAAKGGAAGRQAVGAHCGRLGDLERALQVQEGWAGRAATLARTCGCEL